MARKRDKQPPKTKKYFRPTKKGAGMTKAGVAKYRRDNPGSKLKTAVTGKVKPGSKAAKRRKSFCARSAGQMKKFPKAAKDPNSRLRQARKRWKCQMIYRVNTADTTVTAVMEARAKSRIVAAITANTTLWTSFGGDQMPLNKKGKKILKSMKKTYGKKKGKTVFYASINKGKIKGVKKGKAT